MPCLTYTTDKTVLPNAAVEPERNNEHEKRLQEMQIFLLAYLTAKMANNSQKFDVGVEGCILSVMEAEEQLRKDVHEKNKQLDDQLDLQITSLTPVADAVKQFTEEFQAFCHRSRHPHHELPVKNFFIEGDRIMFLGKVTASLKMSEEVLLQCTQGAQHDHENSAECLRGMKAAAQNISSQGFPSSRGSFRVGGAVIAGRHQTVQIQQFSEELGLTKNCPKQ
uniref:uncharacterized protein LOC123997924 n=1 Tax=Oncorhynchus gorbuscha TaxID=8017 RepID=UPI001EAF7AD5|nr:uncharacterized protein LOC123997924 [Oncorhynchus gorbuscha]